MALQVASKPLEVAHGLQARDSLAPVNSTWPSGDTGSCRLRTNLRYLRYSGTRRLHRAATSTADWVPSGVCSHQYLGGPIEYTLQPLCLYALQGEHIHLRLLRTGSFYPSACSICICREFFELATTYRCHAIAVQPIVRKAAPIEHNVSDCHPVVPSRYALFKAYLSMP